MGLTITRKPAPPADLIEAEARKLYSEGTSVRPTWDQIGDVTKWVWRRMAGFKLAGRQNWFSIHCK